MGVVVLYSDQVHSLTLEGVLGRQVLGVKIVGHSLGVNIEQPAEVLDAVTEGPQCLVVLEVADMVRNERTVSLGQAESVFSSAPQASTGRANSYGTTRGCGT